MNVFPKKIMLLGSGELGREVAIAAKRIGCYVIACDRYENAPAMQIADQFVVLNMNNGTELKKAIYEGGSSIKDFNNTKGKKGNFQQFFNVYDREGEICTRPNCMGKIIRIKISNRSTFFCGKCQK